MLTLQYLTHSQIENLSHDQRINKLLELVSDNKIIILEGRLRKEEETELIARTMEEIGKNDNNEFKGIELSTIEPRKKKHDQEFFKKMKELFINMLLGDRIGMTIIGPATIVKEIKQDPEKIELFINNLTSSGNISTSTNGKKKIKKKPKGKK